MAMNEYIKELLRNLKYDFQNTDLLMESLSHPSLNNNKSGKNHNYTNYERLELLGDAVLSLIITEFLFQSFIEYDEGMIAKTRAALICKDTICEVANKINLPKAIIMSYGEEASGGRSNINNIENAMEALIAAIYLDSNINIIKNIVLTLWSPFLSRIDEIKAEPKTTLQELVQSQKLGIPIYEVIQRTGPAHMPNFEVAVYVGNHKKTGTGASIKSAEKEAAIKMLNFLTNI